MTVKSSRGAGFYVVGAWPSPAVVSGVGKMSVIWPARSMTTPSWPCYIVFGSPTPSRTRGLTPSCWNDYKASVQSAMHTITSPHGHCDGPLQERGPRERLALPASPLETIADVEEITFD